mmetsp:Transcript_10088/g.22725  ORF Transcript_10088/g.22725 Transcript_10088/m.22725 type:complete len:201 (+) Transcript_10088:235-837(+)
MFSRPAHGEAAAAPPPPPTSGSTTTTYPSVPPPIQPQRSWRERFGLGARTNTQNAGPTPTIDVAPSAPPMYPPVPSPPPSSAATYIQSSPTPPPPQQQQQQQQTIPMPIGPATTTTATTTSSSRNDSACTSFALAGFLLSWIPIIGWISACIHIPAKDNRTRRTLGIASLIVASVVFAITIYVFVDHPDMYYDRYNGKRR